MKQLLGLVKMYLKDTVSDAHVSVRMGELFNAPSYPSVIIAPDKSTYESGFFVDDVAILCSCQSTDPEILAGRLFDFVDTVMDPLMEMGFKVGFAKLAVDGVEYLGVDAIAQSVATAVISVRIWTRKNACDPKTKGEK